MSDSLRPHGLYSPWNSPDQNTGVGSLSLLQGIFPTQDQTRVSCIVGGFFTNWAIREAPILWLPSYLSHIYSLAAQRLKRLSAMWETWVQSLGWKDPLEKEMATHSSILAWRIPWTKEPGGLQSTGLQGVGHAWATSLILWPRRG